MNALAFNNPRIQSLRRLTGRRSARVEAGRFVVEGPVLAAEAVTAGWHCIAQYVPVGRRDTAVDGAGEVFELAAGAFERIASTASPQPPIVEVALPTVDASELLASAQLVVVLHRVQDPGNVGTMLRSAEAAGADAVVVTEGTADVFAPKVVRASAGAVFNVPVVAAELDDVRRAGLTTWGTSSHDTAGRHVEEHTSADLGGRIALVLGNEAAGLPAEWTDGEGPIDRWVTIRHRGRAESLNVAMAATVLVFEAARQRAIAAPNRNT